jgi:hypothetical protein
MLRRPLNAYRSTGADPPFTDPAGAHGTALRGRLRHLQRRLLEGVRILQVGHEPVLNRVGPEYSLDLIEFRGCLLPDALAHIQRVSPGTCAAQGLADSGTGSRAGARCRPAAEQRLLDQRRSADGDLPAACCPEPGPVPLTNVAETSNAAVTSTIVSARSRRGLSQLK